jgi:DNA-binding transcriptional ArsR family regulator
VFNQLGPYDCSLLADFFAVFGHPTRLQMLCALRTGRKTVSELAEYADVSMSNASQHLRSMREKGAVSTVRDKQRIYYEITDDRFLEGAALIRQALLDCTRRQAERIAADTGNEGRAD